MNALARRSSREPTPPAVRTGSASALRGRDEVEGGARDGRVRRGARAGRVRSGELEGVGPVGRAARGGDRERVAEAAQVAEQASDLGGVEDAVGEAHAPASARQEVVQDGLDVGGARGGGGLEATLAAGVATVGAVEREQVEVEIRPQVGGEALHDEDGAPPGAP